VLVDTHALVWMLHEPEQLSPKAREVLSDLSNDVLLSVACAWELALKHALGKINLGMPFRPFLEGAIRRARLTMVPITLEHLDRVGELPHHHRDPFDRMLVAQALADGVACVSRDERLDSYGVSRIW
jgi:PIN domain nuclease of toxin-antitoxin system